MANAGGKGAQQERERATWNGFVVLALGIGFELAAIWQLVHTVTAARPRRWAAL